MSIKSDLDLVENALRRLQQLEVTIEETRIELSKIERLLRKALGYSKACLEGSRWHS
jgi:hypothetical protein